jgi:hypothetical protein
MGGGCDGDKKLGFEYSGFKTVPPSFGVERFV